MNGMEWNHESNGLIMEWNGMEWNEWIIESNGIIEWNRMEWN